MFCPKCGTQNPETGKFCRSCGTDLGNVTEVLSGKLPQRNLVDHKGKRIGWDSAIRKFFAGLGFLVVSLALAFSQTGRGWWFWMLIPAFTSMGAGIPQYMQLRQAANGGLQFAPSEQPSIEAPRQNAELPPSQTQYVSPLAEARYKTGDLVPPSVTDGTTRHLEMDKEGETMTLPKI